MPAPKPNPLAAFAAVKSALQNSLGITFEGDKGEHFFLSTLIQTLFYGIFSAWILWRATPEGRQSWYTPREIVRYMVERIDHLLRTKLNEPLGLASPNVQVLDPCCNTGAYLVEVLTRMNRTLLEQAGDDTNYVGSDLRRAATTRIFGFEVMPAPFVIAHLQIATASFLSSAARSAKTRSAT